MVKADIIKNVSDRAYINLNDSANLVEMFFEIIKKTLEAGEPLKISGFGSFDVRVKNPRRGRNPVNGETITLAGRKILRFRPSPVLKQSINS